MLYANIMKRSRGEDEQLHAEGWNSSKVYHEFDSRINMICC